jgi:hypothetical protein
MLKYLIAVLFLIACDPGDDTWNGKAPGAPDCLSAPDHPGLDCDDEEAGDDDEFDGSHDKHTGSMNAPYAATGGNWWGQCPQTYWPYQFACWRWDDPYDYWAAIVNNTPYGQPPHTWTVQHVTWRFCYGGLPSSPIAANSAQLCMPGHCVDISNVGIQASGCRSGNTAFPVTIGSGGASHAQLFIRMHDWWMPSEMGSPDVWVSAIRVNYFH